MTVWNCRSGHSFLVDCGAEESVFPASAADKRHHASSAPLVAANSTLIKTWGKCEASLVLCKGHTFTQDFHVADVTDSILGADFFASNRLDIDMSNKHLISLDDLHVVATGVASVCSTICGLHITRIHSDVIIDEFPELLVPRFKSTDSNKHGVEHYITTDGPPLHACARRLKQKKLEVAKAEPRWKGWASSDAPTLPGPHHCTSSLNQVEAEDHVATFDALTMQLLMTGTPCPTYRTSMVA